jgi:hypothetical protein
VTTTSSSAALVYGSGTACCGCAAPHQISAKAELEIQMLRPMIGPLFAGVSRTISVAIRKGVSPKAGFVNDHS